MLIVMGLHFTVNVCLLAFFLELNDSQCKYTLVNFNNFDLVVNLVAALYTLIEFHFRKRQD